jgi:hypothetical protein
LSSTTCVFTDGATFGFRRLGRRGFACKPASPSSRYTLTDLDKVPLADAHCAGDQFRRKTFLEVQLDRFAPNLKRVGMRVRTN